VDRGFSRFTVDLAEACKVLAKSHRVQTLLRGVVGGDVLPNALKLMESGDLEGDLGATVHDLFLDVIDNEATTVWSGFIYDGSNKWPLRVHEYEGVFWVSALESDPVGYFLNRSIAIEFAYFNWDDVYEDDDNLEMPL